MIPSAILNGTVYIKEKELEINVLEISNNYFLFRALSEYQEIFLRQKVSVRLHFYRFDQAAYTEAELNECQIEVEEKALFYTVYRVQVLENASYEATVNQLTQEYLSYIRLFQEEEPADMAKVLVGYPAEKEKVYPSSYEALCRKIQDSLQVEIAPSVNLGLSLETPWQQEAFLQQGLSCFTNLPGEIRYLYAGNQWCIHLLPKFEKLKELLMRCQELEVTLVYQLPPVKESELAEVKKLLEELSLFLQEKNMAPLEIIVNDWGILEFLAGYSTFSLTMGILMIKQKKDPRIKWKNGAERDGVTSKRPGWMTDVFLEYTKTKYHVERYSMEYLDADMEEVLPQVPVTFYGPWYQMNTSTLCPLRAAILEGDRGCQKETKTCEQFCRNWNFLYPEHLHMAGRYNSIWGYQEKMKVTGKRVDRLVWNLVREKGRG